MTQKLTQRQKLLKRLKAGKNMLVTEARNRLKIGNLSARIRELRVDGYDIYTNKVRGQTAYRLDNRSTPVRRDEF